MIQQGDETLGKVEISKKTFEAFVEKNLEDFDYSYLDTIMFLMEKYEIDEDTIKGYMTPLVVEKLENECINRRLINDTKRSDTHSSLDKFLD